MQFRLSTLLLLFVVLASSLAMFGGNGVVAFVFLVLLAISIARPVWLLALLGFMLLLCLLLSPNSFVGERHFRRRCMYQLYQIASALQEYRDANGCFPPAYIANENGKPMHSWRVLILPYMEEEALYKQYDFDEPWDGPNNKKLLASRPYLYACPSDYMANGSGDTCTNYVAVVGTNAAWSADGPKNPTGDLSTTIMVVEVTGENPQWTEPKDLSVDALLNSSPGALTVSSKHLSDDGFFTSPSHPGAHVALADSSVRFLPGGLLASDKFPDLLKIGDFREECLDAGWSGRGRHFHWANCTAFAIWLASTGWLLARAVRSRKKAVVPAVE